MEKEQIPSMEITLDKKAIDAVKTTEKTFNEVKELLILNGKLLAEILDRPFKAF